MTLNVTWEMLMNTLRVLVNNYLKKIFMKKWKKNLIFWQFFFISPKNDVKIFLKWIVNQLLIFHESVVKNFPNIVY